MTDPLQSAYRDHKQHARNRGIQFLLTYEEWVMIWINSGKLVHRGNGARAYCMGRFRDRGPYVWWNVKIITNAENIREAWLGKNKNPPSPKLRKSVSIGIMAARQKKKHQLEKLQAENIRLRGFLARYYI